MKTAFALAFLAAGAEATITAVTGEWTAKDHVADSPLQICATHGVAVTSGASNTITYSYSAATCTAASTTATTGTELKWGTADTKNNAVSALADKATCKIDDTAKTVVCNTVGVTGGQFSCVKLLKCRPTAPAIPMADIKVKQSETDTAYVVAQANADFAANGNTVTFTKPTAAEAKVGAASFTLELKVTATADIGSGQAITILAPGYKFLSGGICTLGSTASTAFSADSTGKATFLSAEASGTSAKDLKCTKVQAVTAMAASQFAVISGGTSTTTLTTVSTAGFVASPIIAAATTTTAGTGDSASTVSLSAAALLLAASMYL